MKIVYISTPSFADTDAPLLKSLQESGVEVYYVLEVYGKTRSTLISFDSPKDKIGLYNFEEFRELDFIREYIGTQNAYILQRKSRKSITEAFQISRILQSFINDIHPSVIHQINLPYFTFIPFVLWNRSKYVLTVHDPIPHVGEYSWKLTLSRKLIFPIVNKIILLNDKTKDQFCSLYKVLSKKVYFSHLGLLEWMNSFGEESKYDNYILFYGRITPYKGIEYLLEAMDKVHEVYPNVKLIIAGSGKLYFDKSQCDKREYVTLINKFIELDELSTLIKNSKFVVCPYTEATQSGVVASVLALDTPIIVTRVGALPEMIDEGETGYVVSPKNSTALTEYILRMLSSDENINQMRITINIRKQNGKYSWKKIAQKYIAIYNA